MFTVAVNYFAKDNKSFGEAAEYLHIKKIRYAPMGEVILEGDDILNHIFSFKANPTVTLYAEDATYNVVTTNIRDIQVCKED